MTIAFDRVRFTYKKDEQPILNNLSFEAKAGDRIALLGPSGSGKTTIFRLLLGFEQPDAGEVVVNGQNLTSKNIQQLRKQTSWLPQDLDLGEGLVKEVFFYPFEFKTNANERPPEKTVLNTLKTLGLSEKVWEEKFEELSTGQRQRVGVALCHHLHKPILLLDEPTSALDNDSKEKVRRLLFEKEEQLIISTSHDPWWIERCNKVIDLDAE